MNSKLGVGYCNAPHSFTCNGVTAAPNNTCTQELYGTNAAQSVAATEIKVVVRE